MAEVEKEKEKAKAIEKEMEDSAGTAEHTEAGPDLKAELESAQAKAAEYLDGWQRARAEFANYKKRVEADRAETYQHATGAVLNRFLSVLDDFDRAMKDKPADFPAEGEFSRWAEGIALIYRKLQNILEAEGITPIPAEGQSFDPAVHEAVTHEESPDHAEGQIIAEVRKGYRIGDRVLRPALVRVAK